MRKLLAAIGVAAAVAVVLPTTASAGGWVTVSLDSAPAVQAGDDTEIGFTVLRHGVTPESSDDIDVVLTAADGTTHRFDAVAEGAVGHHVATITLPEEGSYRWFVTGQFVDAELGTLEVGAAPGGPPTWTWNALQWGSAAAAALLAGLAVLDFRRTRRDRVTAPTTA